MPVRTDTSTPEPRNHHVPDHIQKDTKNNRIEMVIVNKESLAVDKIVQRHRRRRLINI